MIDTSAPLSLGAVLAGIAILISWVGFAITIRTFRAAERDRETALVLHAQEEEARIERMATRACKELAASDDYILRRERAIEQVSKAVVDEEFRMRADSFVDAKVFQRADQDLNRHLSRLEASVNANTAELGRISGKISQDITTQIAAFLSSRVYGPGEKKN